MADTTDWSWGDILKGIMGGVGAYAGYQAGQPTTTTQTNAMSPEMQGQWNAYRDFANQVANRPYQNTVAPFTADQYGAMDQIRNLAGGGPEQAMGSQALQAFLSGGQQNPYQGQNPWLDAMIGRSSDEIMNRMNTGAFNSGSFGNSGVAAATGKAIGDATNALQFQNYNQSANLAENALNRTMSAIPQSLGFQQQNLGNASAQLQSGAMQQQLGQQTLNNWWQYPQQQLQIMGSPLNFGQNTGTQTATVPGNTALSALGGGLLGLNFGNWFNNAKPA